MTVSTQESTMMKLEWGRGQGDYSVGKVHEDLLLIPSTHGKSWSWQHMPVILAQGNGDRMIWG